MLARRDILSFLTIPHEVIAEKIMFKFDFDIEDLDEEHAGPSSSTVAEPSNLQSYTILEPFSEIPLLQLVRLVLPSSWLSD